MNKLVRELAGKPLTEREDEVMWLICQGLSNKLIGAELGISESTAKFHVARALAKMGTTVRTKAAVDFVLSRSALAQQKLLPTGQLKLVA